MGAERRLGIISEAADYVSKDRNASYGEPEVNFGRIAEIWNAQGFSVDGRPVNSVDVALAMVGMKLARLRTNPGHRDSWVDGVGYFACGGDVALPDHKEGEALGVTDQHRNDFSKVYRDAVISQEDLVTPDPDLGAQVRQQLKQAWEAGDTANVDELAEREKAQTKSSGWVSDNRCGTPNPHGAHPYGGTFPYDYYCDGYVAPGWQAQRSADVEAVKKVADDYADIKTRSFPVPEGRNLGVIQEA